MPNDFRKKAVVIHPDQTTRYAVSIAAENLFDLEPVEVKSLSSEGRKWVESDETAITFLSRAEFDDFQSLNAKSPVILIEEPGDLPTVSDAQRQGQIQKPIQVSDLKRELARLLGKKSTGIQIPDFLKVRLESLLRLGILDHDVYLNISEKRFIEFVPKGSDITEEDLSLFEGTGIEYLYIKESDYSYLLSSVGLEIQDKIKGKDHSVGSTYQVSQTAVDLAHSAFKKFGWGDAIQELVKNNVDLAVKTIQANPDLAKMLAASEVKREAYMASHSVLLAYVACGVYHAMEGQETSTLQHLTLAALLHDISLSITEYEEIQLLEKLARKEEFHQDPEVKSYLQHPHRSAELLEKFKDIPKEAHLIIKLHHESPDGKGFPQAYTAHSIGLIPAIFILSEDLVDFMFEQGEGYDLNQFFDQRAKHYQEGHFKAIYQRLSIELAKKNLAA